MCSSSSRNIDAGENSLSNWEDALDRAEDALRRISALQCRLQKTGHPDVLCSTLPAHWRSNKSLPTPFVVLAFCPIPDGTRVCISAGNDDNFCADVKNNMAEFNGQMARFSDLRFVGKSGRGKNFNLSITIFTQPHPQLVVVQNVVKVTVDGPRDSRNAAKYMNAQYIPIPKRIKPGSSLDQISGVHQLRRKNADRRCSSDSASTKVHPHHPTASAPTAAATVANFLIGPSNANVLPPLAPPFFPHGFPPLAFNGLFPRLMNGQLGATKIGALNPTSLHCLMNFRPMLNMAASLRMPMAAASSPLMDSAMAQMATSRLLASTNAGDMGGMLPNGPIVVGHQLRHPPSSLIPAPPPLLTETLHAAISAAAAAVAAPRPSALFPPSNSANLLAAKAMAGLFANTEIREGNGGSTLGKEENEEKLILDGRRRNGEEEEGKNMRRRRSSIDEGNETEESREEEVHGEAAKCSSADETNKSYPSNDGKLSKNRKRSRSEPEGNEDGPRKQAKRENLVNGGDDLFDQEEKGGNVLFGEGKTTRRLALKVDGQRVEEEVDCSMTTSLQHQQHGGGLWRPFHP